MKPRRIARAASWALAFLLSSAPPVAARDPATDAPSAAAAEALYQEGKRLLLQGATALACDRLQASQSVQPGIGTLLLLGHCYEALGRSASAWATFRAAESSARSAHQSERAEIARVRALALEPRLSRLEIQLPAGIATDGWSVRQDERVLPLASLGTPLPVDPGEHEIVVSAPGFDAWSVRIRILPERALNQVRVPPLSVHSAPTQTPVQSPASSAAALPGVALEAPSDWQRTLGYTATGLGAAGLALGLGFTLHAQHQYDQSLARCRTERTCSASGVERREAAEASARAATIASISGVALTLSGLALWWTSSADEPAPADSAALRLGLSTLAEPGALGLEAKGAF